MSQKYRNLKHKTVDVILPDGQKKQVLMSPDPDHGGQIYMYIPKNLDGTGYGVACNSMENAIKHMVEYHCEHNVIANDTVSDNPKAVPLPYKCTKCNKHFIYY